MKKLTFAAAIVGLFILLTAVIPYRKDTKQQKKINARWERTAPEITPVTGPSWLKQLGMSKTRDTAMGRMGGVTCLHLL